MKVVRKSREKIYEEKFLEIFQNMPQTEILPLLPDYAQHEWLYRLLADMRDRFSGITIQGTGALELLFQELSKCREEHEDECAEKDPEWREYEDEMRRIDQFKDECRRKWEEQGKTERECRKMWPQAFADWRAERNAKEWSAAELDTMLNRKLGLNEDSAEQPVPMQM